MWEFILNLTVREADASDDLVRDVDECTDFHPDSFALLVELRCGLLELAFVPANEKSCDVMRVRQLPRWTGLLTLAHEFEVVNHLLGFTSLLQTSCHQLYELPLVGLVSLAVDSEEDWSTVVLYDWLSVASTRASCSLTPSILVANLSNRSMASWLLFFLFHGTCCLLRIFRAPCRCSLRSRCAYLL